MLMQNLKSLHESMNAQTNAHGDVIELQRFRSVQGAAVFECIFSTGERPYKLSLTSRGTEKHPKSEFFLFDVSDEYTIPNYFHGDTHPRLLELLKTLGGMAGNRLYPADFLAQLDANVPVTATIPAIPSSDYVLENRPDLTDERDKPYWSHWSKPRSKADGSPGQVSSENQEKTATLLGSAALTYSRTMRMSSCWSPVPTSKNWRQHS
ncbi:DUF6037 family protein [Pseudomonas aeruginosa]|uniref:DUF6037 family protein n=1 Tax=Pseudomonas aeruginosa TaxID=287 RepID=UPI001A257E15|nr:DUF6037 family protein [Pseudomonas aeruginosa]MBG7441610.1 hypothetical protein [Pseudomonas aeruginosa]MDU0512622.1 DUF6037 family protein [Pseudomonas aeruginosa]